MFEKFVAIVGSSLILASCGGKTEEASTSAAPVKDTLALQSVSGECSKLLAQAKVSDEILMRAVVLDKAVANKAIADFNAFASACQDDSLAPVFYLKAGQVAQAIGSYTQAKAMLENCINKHSNFKNKGAALFLLAQLYDDAKMLNNEEKAKEYYEQIIKEFPDSPYAGDSKASIRNLGKTDEELVQEFLKKNK
jgi:tetratricopeptide (TPR) repeat protein